MKRNLLLLVGIFLIVLIGVFSYKIFHVNELSIYTDPEYHFSIKYDKSWIKANGYENRFDGDDGFFGYDAFDGQGWNIDEVAKHLSSHHLLPYGTNPYISKLTIHGQEARLIIPSEDQYKEWKNQAEVIIKYPQGIVINDYTYYYFIIYADKNHIQKIAKSLKFVSE